SARNRGGARAGAWSWLANGLGGVRHPRILPASCMRCSGSGPPRSGVRGPGARVSGTRPGRGCSGVGVRRSSLRGAALEIRPVLREAPVELAEPLRVDEGFKNSPHLELIVLPAQAPQEPELDDAIDVGIDAVHELRLVR